MNKTPTLLFTLIGLTLSLSAITTIPSPAVYAGGGDNDDRNDNKQKVEDGSAAAIADCDWNDVEQADFDCIASAASDESVIRDREPTPPEPGTLNVCKEVVNIDNANAVPSDFILRFDRGNNPTPDEFPGNADCTEVTIGPGQYVIAEKEFNRDLTLVSREASGDCVSTIGIESSTATGTITAGETQTCTITNTVSE